MTLTDILLITALAVFVIAWWIRKTPARRIVLIASAAAAVAIGIAGFLDNRWQDATGAFIGLVFLIGLGRIDIHVAHCIAQARWMKARKRTALRS